MNAGQCVRTACRVLLLAVAVLWCGRFFIALLDNLGLAGEGLEQQQADTAERPGDRVDDFQGRGQQGVTQHQHGVRVAAGEGARQVVGEHQQGRGGTQAGQPRTVVCPAEHGQQGADDHDQRATQGIAQQQAAEREAESGDRLVA
ncbi:hypothetical protein D3C81_1672310 [compost metagenome]